MRSASRRRSRWPSTNIPEWLTRASIPPNAYVVILTRGHRYDLDALRALATRDLRYLGLIGSRAKVARLHEALRDEGVAFSNLDGLHAPVGLDIGAVSPQEIAVSILAELIAVKYGKLERDEADTLPRSVRSPALVAAGRGGIGSGTADRAGAEPRRPPSPDAATRVAPGACRGGLMRRLI